MPPVGGIALGLGQGLLDAAKAIPAYQAQKQQALELALKQKSLAAQVAAQRAGEARATMGQLPGGVEISPQVFNQQFADTPSAAQWTPPVPMANALSAIEQQPATGNPLQQGPPVPSATSYTSIEPLAQWRTGRTADASIARVNAQQQGQNDRWASRNDVMQKIASAQVNVEQQANAIRLQLGRETNATRRAALAQGLVRLQQAQQALLLKGTEAGMAAKFSAYRAATTPGALNSQLINNTMGGINIPDLPDPDKVSSDIDTIMKGLPDLSNIGASGAAPVPQTPGMTPPPGAANPFGLTPPPGLRPNNP